MVDRDSEGYIRGRSRPMEDSAVNRCYMPIFKPNPDPTKSVCAMRQCDKMRAPGRHNFCRVHLIEFYEWLFASRMTPWRTAV